MRKIKGPAPKPKHSGAAVGKSIRDVGMGKMTHKEARHLKQKGYVPVPPMNSGRKAEVGRAVKGFGYVS